MVTKTEVYGYFFIDLGRYQSQILVFYPGEYHAEPYEENSILRLISPIHTDNFKRVTTRGRVEDAIVALYVELMHRLKQPEYDGLGKNYAVIVEVETELLDHQLVGTAYRVSQ